MTLILMSVSDPWAGAPKHKLGAHILESNFIRFWLATVRCLCLVG